MRPNTSSALHGVENEIQCIMRTYIGISSEVGGASNRGIVSLRSCVRAVWLSGGILSHMNLAKELSSESSN